MIKDFFYTILITRGLIFLVNTIAYLFNESPDKLVGWCALGFIATNLYETWKLKVKKSCCSQKQ